MSSEFSRTLIVNKDEKHKKDVRLLDGDVTVYGIFREDKGKIAQVVKFEQDGVKTVLAEVEWNSDKRDRIRLPGKDFEKVSKAWTVYDITKHSERFISSFTGADGQQYIWHLQGSMKVLSVGDKAGPVVAKHVDHGTGGTLDLKPAASAAGDMLFVTFLQGEGYRGRVRFSWFYALSGSGVGGGLV